MRLTRRLPASLIVLVVAIGAALVAPAGATAQTAEEPIGSQAADARDGAAFPVAAAAGDSLTFTGHGWGHGRGMGQYGALGYAVNHGWGYRQILGHYYSNTTVGSVANSVVSVELVGQTGKELRAISRGLTINGETMPDKSPEGSSVRVTPNGPGFLVETATTCARPGDQTWIPLGTFSTVTIGSTSQTLDGLVRVCQDAGERGYRGDLTVQHHAETGAQTTFNRVPLEDYIRGVVPRESPDWFGSEGGGKGLEALKAQTVAARSYAMGSGPRKSGAQMCDTVSCQVYGGATYQQWSQPLSVLEAPNANAAVAATSGEVRRLNGKVARTEFSSSTGGWTAPGTFPAVQDLGDSYAKNPNHTWTTTLSLTDVAAALRLPGVRSVSVTGRNGLGEWGGRVTSVRVVDTNGTAHTFTGAVFRSAMGTSRFRSDWFVISGVARAEAENVVKALYQDVLGRAVDPSGLKTWTDYVLADGSPRELVGAIATSTERMNKLVAAQYEAALHRSPEPGGLQTWMNHLRAGNGVYDLQIGIYGSAEALQTLGGGDLPTWVGGMYEAMLGRPAGASERQYWADLAVVHGRQAVVAAIARSEEATMRRLTVYYRTFLLRDVDLSGKATFLPLMTGRGDFDIPVALGSSPEYWARAQTRGF